MLTGGSVTEAIDAETYKEELDCLETYQYLTEVDHYRWPLDWSLYLHISYNIFTLILYKLLLNNGFLTVPRSMVWNEEEDK